MAVGSITRFTPTPKIKIWKSKTAGIIEVDLNLKQVPMNIAGFLTQRRWRRLLKIC